MSAAYDKLIRSKAAHLKESHKEVESPKKKKRTKAHKGVSTRKAFEFEHIYDTELRAQSLDTIVAEVRSAQPFHIPPSTLRQGAPNFYISNNARATLDAINAHRSDQGMSQIDVNEIGTRMQYADGRRVNITDLNRFMNYFGEDDDRGREIAFSALAPQASQQSGYSEEQSAIHVDPEQSALRQRSSVVFGPDGWLPSEYRIESGTMTASINDPD